MPLCMFCRKGLAPAALRSSQSRTACQQSRRCSCNGSLELRQATAAGLKVRKRSSKVLAGGFYYHPNQKLQVARCWRGAAMCPLHMG